MTCPPVCVLAWHGTRGAAGRADTARLTAAVGEKLAAAAETETAAKTLAAAAETAAATAGRPAPRVVAAFVDTEVQRPGLDAVLAAELADPAARVVVVPALLAAGFHVRTDIPAQVAACPDPSRVHVAGHLGDDDDRPPAELVDAVCAAAPDPGQGPLTLCSAGSSVAAVDAELGRLAAAVGEALGRDCAHRALAVARADVNKHDVVPLLLAEGHFAEQMRRRPGRCGTLLGSGPAAGHIVALLCRRYREAAAGWSGVGGGPGAAEPAR